MAGFLSTTSTLPKSRVPLRMLPGMGGAPVPLARGWSTGLREGEEDKVLSLSIGTKALVDIIMLHCDPSLCAPQKGVGAALGVNP